MFNKKYCKECGEKTNKKYRFCPSCGTEINNHKKEDWGMLGKSDSIDEGSFQSPFFGGFSGKMLNSMIGNVMKMLEKEMQKDMKDTQKIPRSNFKLMINGKEIKFSNPKEQIKQDKPKRIPRMEFKQEQLKAFTSLPKEEPKTNLKRFGDKIIYEIEMPEVKSFEDILINYLENSIEIKAVGKTKAYSKIIPINMPIVSQNLSQGKLVLELMGN